MSKEERSGGCEDVKKREEMITEKKSGREEKTREVKRRQEK